jgi:hypothetical protein
MESENLTWRKASRSAANGDCVEVGTHNGRVAAIRDSKRPDGGYLTVTPVVFATFVTSVRNGNYDLPMRLSNTYSMRVDRQRTGLLLTVIRLWYSCVCCSLNSG